MILFIQSGKNECIRHHLFAIQPFELLTLFFSLIYLYAFVNAAAFSQTEGDSFGCNFKLKAFLFFPGIDHANWK